MKVFSALLLLFLSACMPADYTIIGGAETIIVEKEVIIEKEVEVIPEIWVESFTQVGVFDDVDILWVVDRSCSMNAHDTKLIDGVTAMMNALPLDVRWRLSIISTDDRQAQPQNFPLTPGDVAQDAIDMLRTLDHYHHAEKGFDALYNYMTNDAYAATWLRPEVPLLVVFVSDEEEQSTVTFTNVANFNLWYDYLRPQTFLASIVNVGAADTLCTTYYSATNTGTRYMDATNYFGGNIIDICDTDWSSGVEEATSRIEIIEEWELHHTPFPESIVIFVNEDPYDGANWHYDEPTNTIIFDLLPEENDLVEIAYAVKKYAIGHSSTVATAPVSSGAPASLEFLLKYKP